MRATLAILSTLALLAAPALAQDTSAGLRAWRLAGCASCHGVFGEGGGGGEQPEGPSLRRTSLDRKALAETVRCGRPGTRMPFFLKGAWTTTACFGAPVKDEAPADVTGPGRLEAPVVEALVDYLFARVVGQKDAITLAECAAYYGNPDHAGCDSHR